MAPRDFTMRSISAMKKPPAVWGPKRWKTEQNLQPWKFYGSKGEQRGESWKTTGHAFITVNPAEVLRAGSVLQHFGADC